jgi:hypothetical protein
MDVVIGFSGDVYTLAMKKSTPHGDIIISQLQSIAGNNGAFITDSIEYSGTFPSEYWPTVQNYLKRNNINYWNSSIELAEIKNYKNRIRSIGQYYFNGAILSGNVFTGPIGEIFRQIYDKDMFYVNSFEEGNNKPGFFFTDDQALRFIARLRENGIPFTNNYRVFTPTVTPVYNEERGTVEVDVDTLSRIIAILKIQAEKYNSGDLAGIAKGIEKLRPNFKYSK